MAYDLRLDEEPAETRQQESTATDADTTNHINTVTEESGDYVVVTEPSDVQSQPEVIEPVVEPAQNETKEAPEQESAVIAEAFDAESKTVEVATSEQPTTTILPALIQEQDSQGAAIAETIAEWNQDDSPAPVVEKNGHQRSNEEFQHVERRGGRGRGGYRGGRGDGFFRGNTRGRGNFRGDGRGDHRGRASFRGRGRGGQQQPPAAIAGQQ